MLEKLLSLLAQEQACTVNQAAARLGVSPELVEAMLSDLSRAGYLQEVIRCGKGACTQCALGEVCGPEGKAWVVVRQGSK